VIERRSLLGAAVVGALDGGRGTVSAAQPKMSLAADLAEMLMMGFSGSTVASPSARALAQHLDDGRVGSVVFVLENVGSRIDVAGLLRRFGAGRPRPPLLAIDHEGGDVQRLTARHGFTVLPAARVVGATFTPERARALYARAGRELRTLGFNFNLAPVLDLDDPLNPAVGHYKRAFSTRPERVATFATAVVDGFSSAGIICALKHFPGQGRTHVDSHDDLPDITSTWSRADLEPFEILIRNRRAPVIMGGHFRLRTIDPRRVPTSLSRAVMTGLLRGWLGFGGVAMTDDLDMAAIAKTIDRREAVIRALAAGVDLMMIRNVTNFDPDLPRSIEDWVGQAIATGRLQRTEIAASAARVRSLRAQYA
jgi:beta-N-acetylhexosaminidase